MYPLIKNSIDKNMVLTVHVVAGVLTAVPAVVGMVMHVFLAVMIGLTLYLVYLHIKHIFHAFLPFITRKILPCVRQRPRSFFVFLP